MTTPHEDLNYVHSVHDSRLVYDTYADMLADTGVSADLVGKLSLINADGSSFKLEQVTPCIKWSLFSGTNITRADDVLYVDGVAGNDTTGNGSASYPFKSFAFLNSLPEGKEHEIKIKPKAGTYTYFPQVVGCKCSGNGRIIIDASAETYPVVAGPFTVQSVADVTPQKDSYALAKDITVSGAPGWGVDAYYGKFMHMLTGNWAGRVLPIFKNTADTVRTNSDWYVFQAGDTFNIVDCPVVIDVDHTVTFQGGSELTSFKGSLGSVPSSPDTPFLITCGVEFNARNGSDDNVQNAITMSAINGFFSFTTFGNKSAGRVLDCVNSICNREQLPSGTLDMDILGDYWYIATLVVSDSGTPPTGFHYDVDLENSSFDQFCCRRVVHVGPLGEASFAYVLCGGVLATTQGKFSTDYLYIEQIGFTDVGIALYGCGAFIYAAYVTGATVAMLARYDTQTQIHWFKGAANTDDYAVHLNWQSNVNNLGGADVNIVGAVGAIRFLFDGSTQAAWPTSGNNYTDGNGCFVSTE